tara:strand:+ start:194 stop:613 length:420 start_codon:yes stop_codon:yes gene_type:complete
MVILQEPQEDLEVVVGIAVMQLEIPLLLVHLKVILEDKDIPLELEAVVELVDLEVILLVQLVVLEVMEEVVRFMYIHLLVHLDQVDHTDIFLVEVVELDLVVEVLVDMEVVVLVFHQVVLLQELLIRGVVVEPLGSVDR